MPYSISTRELEPKERELLRRLARPDGVWILLPILGWGLLGFLFGGAIERLVACAGAEVSPYFRFTFGVLGVAGGCIRADAWQRQIKSVKANATSDLARNLVQVIHVWDAQCIEDAEEPALFFQVALGKILTLGWVFLCEPNACGPNDIKEGEYYDGERRFPCSEFKLHRSPHRSLFRIEVLGEPITPMKDPESRDVCADEEVEFLVGSLDDLPGAMERRESIADFDFDEPVPQH